MDELTPRFEFSDAALECRWRDACAAMEAAIVEWWGERCPEYDSECPLCQRWQAFDELRGIDDTEVWETLDGPQEPNE